MMGSDPIWDKKLKQMSNEHKQKEWICNLLVNPLFTPPKKSFNKIGIAWEVIDLQFTIVVLCLRSVAVFWLRYKNGKWGLLTDLI